MDRFQALELKIESEYKGWIDEKNSAINLRPIDNFVWGNPYTCDRVTKPRFRLAGLRERIPDSKGFPTAHPQIARKYWIHKRARPFVNPIPLLKAMMRIDSYLEDQ